VLGAVDEGERAVGDAAGGDVVTEAAVAREGGAGGAGVQGDEADGRIFLGC
jgi:hypothetical protein